MKDLIHQFLFLVINQRHVIITCIATRMRTESAEKGKNMIDHEKIEQAVRLLLEGMGEDVNREGLIDTPDRIARMYEEIYGGMDEDAGKHLSKTFTVDSHEMVIEKGRYISATATWM